MKRSFRGLLILSLMLGGIVVAGYAEALEYQSEDVNVQFTFNYNSQGSTEPTLSMTTPGTVSVSVASGNKAISSTSNMIVVTTNNASGYTLSAKIGCATASSGCYSSSALSNGSQTFSMVGSTTALTSGKWGISTSSSATTSSNFSPIALYSATNGTILNKTTSATGTAASGYSGTANTPFVVGVYAAASQAAGSYTNKVVFTAVTNS